MDLNNEKIRETCTDAVFERGRDYRDEGRVQRIKRFGDVVIAAVRGTSLYDVTVDIGEHTIDARCTCPYEGAGECKHVVAVLLDVVADPPQDESERVERVIHDVSSNDLRAFVRDDAPIAATGLERDEPVIAGDSHFETIPGVTHETYR